MSHRNRCKKTISLATLILFVVFGVMTATAVVAWGQEPPPPPTFEQWMSSSAKADLNQDGKVDEADYEIFLSGGQSPPDGQQPGRKSRPAGIKDRWRQI